MPAPVAPTPAGVPPRPDLEAAAVTLLGALLRVDGEDGTVAVRICEVEAYAGADDPASHTARGRTARNATMFGPPDHLYVYRSYGIHWCANVVAGPEGVGEGVLLRAGEVVDGLALARERRPGIADRDLARGPGRLGAALGIDARLDGHDLARPPARLVRVEPVAGAAVERGPRVGVSSGVDHPWRFWLAGDRHVSAYRRHPRAPRTPGGTQSTADRRRRT